MRKDHQKSKSDKFSLAVDLISGVDNDSMVDIMLLANDGGEIPASRFVISARSTVLQRTLFKENVEQRELKLDYSTNVVRALVKYCSTNDLVDDVWRPRNESVARELIHLYDAANTYELIGLKDLICAKLKVLARTHPNLACAIYDECASYGSSGGQVPAKPKSIALKAIRHNPTAALLKKNEHGNQEAGVAALRASTAEEIIGDPKMNAEEITMFRAAVIWADAPFLGDGVNYAYRLQERRHVAKQMISRCINLSNIAPSQLLGFVSECDLVDGEEVSQAIVNLALRVELEGFPVSKHRSDAPPPITMMPAHPSKSHSTGHHDTDNSLLMDMTDMTDEMSLVDDEAQSFAGSTSSPQRSRGKKPAVVSPKASEKSLKPPGRPKSKKTVGQAIGFYLADKVDTMCVHPYKHGADMDGDDNNANSKPKGEF